MAGKRRNVRALAIAVLTPLGGCASILSNEINRRHLEPFGGTLLDALVITAPFNPTMWRNIASEPWSVVLWPIALVDLPFSLVFDLVTL
ncbi:hypothetical protein HY251_08810, partial [bacterium]|nr:hypothetical protein [bacterium]